MRPVLNQQSRQRHGQRQGTTLTEVLMSLLVMSIGVVSLATLFPISALRVLEATNMTNSTVLRYNAEGLVDSVPSILFDPDGLASTRHSGTNYIVDPLGKWDIANQLSRPINDPSLSRFEYNRATTITRPRAGFQSWFLGESETSPAVFTSLERTRHLVSLPDTLTVVVEATLADPFASVTATTVTFPSSDGMDVVDSTVTAAVAAGLSDSGMRVTLFDTSNSFSEVKTVSAVMGNPSGNTVEFVEPLSSELQTAGIGLVRLELVDNFYTFMLSVRNTAGHVNADVVVFFKRELTELSNQVYVGELRRYNLGADGVPGSTGDDNMDGNNEDVREIGSPGSDDTVNNTVTVDWTETLYPSAPERPPLRRGGYVYDPVNGLWYRIRSISDAVPVSNTTAVLALDEAIRRDNTEDLDNSGGVNLPGEDRNGNGAVDRGGLIIPKGVIAVFPLRAKQLD